MNEAFITLVRLNQMVSHSQTSAGKSLVFCSDYEKVAETPRPSFATQSHECLYKQFTPN